MTPPVSGGVPEQGLREAAQQVLDESGPDISASLGALEKLRVALARPAIPRTHEQLAEIIGPPDCCEEFERR